MSRLKELRKAKGYTQIKMQLLTGIDQSDYSKIENGRRYYTFEQCKRIAAALDTTPDEFLVGAARNENEEWRSVAELLRKMDGKQLDLARSFLTWLTGQTL